MEAEASGDPVFGSAFDIDPEKQELRDRLEELERILDQNGIDIQDMTNKQVRDAMAALETYHQNDNTIDTDTLNDLADFVFLSAEHDPQMLARAAASLPEISLTQDFGDIKFTDPKTVNGQKVLHTRAANDEFRRAKKRKNLLETLKDCLGG